MLEAAVVDETSENGVLSEQLVKDGSPVLKGVGRVDRVARVLRRERRARKGCLGS